MGDAKRKSRKREEILAGEQRCIYCISRPDSLEHMPPKSIFGTIQRPSGLEFASCTSCNSGSRASDAAAALLARIDPDHTTNLTDLKKARQLLSTLTRHAPNFVQELFDPAKREAGWAKGRSQFLAPMTRLTLDGPATTALMQAFGAKLGMALFREHTGSPLNAEGFVFVQHYFNAGLYRAEVESTISILPMFGQLAQGKKQSGRLFNYRFNTDERSILAAFCAFNDNLFFRIFAVSDPIYFEDLAKLNHYGPIRIGKLQTLAKAWGSATGEHIPP